MSNIADDLVQVDEAYVLNKAAADFKLLATDLQKDLNLVINIDQSYISLSELVDELRAIHFDRASLFPEKPINELTEQEFDTVLATVTNSPPTSFSPPIAAPYNSIGVDPRRNTPVRLPIYTIPNYPGSDPRQTGRLLCLKPRDIMKTPEVLKWLLVNSTRYGFLVYLDLGLYWVGANTLSSQLQQAVDRNVIIRRFLKDPRQLIFLQPQVDVFTGEDVTVQSLPTNAL